MVDAAGTTAWTYNAADELTTFTSPQGVVQYEYDAADGGKLKKLIEPGIGETLYQYAAGTGQLWKITNPHAETTEFGYDEGQRPSWTNFASGAREEYGYDYRGRMESVALKNSAGATLRLTEYAFDPASNLVSTTVDGVSTSFVHDAIGQLLSETRTGSAPIAYTYDANGNRLTRTSGGVTETYVSNERDELTAVLVGGVPVRELTVDLAGRTTAVAVPGVGTTSLTYDLEDRVTGISYPGSGSSSFVYNGFDTRVSSSGPSGSRTYRRAGAGVTAPVLGDGVSHFTPSLSSRTSGESRFQHFGLKNIDAQSTASESISASQTYDAFGNTVASSGSWSGPFGYGGAFGYQSDADSGLQLLGHRYYDPSSGRFLSRDKARDGRNWYGYCGNAPLTRADPTGNAFHLLAIAAVLILSTSVAHAPTSPTDQRNYSEELGWAKIDLLQQLFSRRRQSPPKQFFPKPKQVPNPFGRHGSPPHSGTVEDVVQSGRRQGWDVVSGGKQLGEKQVPGTKRSPDAWFKIDGEDSFTQVGRGRKDGTPIQREWEAIGDLVEIGPVDWVPYKLP